MKARITPPPCSRCGRQWSGRMDDPFLTFVYGEDDRPLTACAECITEFGALAETHGGKVPPEKFDEFWRIDDEGI